MLRMLERARNYRNKRALLATLVAAPLGLFAAYATVASATPVQCTEGAQLNGGTVSISFPNSTTAQANIVNGWAFCGDAVTGYTTTWGNAFTKTVSPGQTGITITVYPCTENGGCREPYYGASAGPVTAPTSGGSTGGGTTPQCRDGQDNDGNNAADYGGANGLPPDSGCTSLDDTTESGGHAVTTSTTTTTTTAPNPDADLDGYCSPGMTSTAANPCSGVDNCPDARNDQADGDHDGVGDICDNTPFPYDIEGGTVTLIGQADLGDGQGTYNYGCAYRWKTQTYKVEWREHVITQTWLAMEISFTACYKLNGGFIWVKPSAAKAKFSLLPWTWQDTNDNGFPNYQVLAAGHSVAINWQATAAICAWKWPCGPSVHPWVTVTFSDNNTAVVTRGKG